MPHPGGWGPMSSAGRGAGAGSTAGGGRRVAAPREAEDAADGNGAPPRRGAVSR